MSSLGISDVRKKVKVKNTDGAHASQAKALAPLIGIKKPLPKLEWVKLFSLKSNILRMILVSSLLDLFYCEFIFKQCCTWVGCRQLLIIFDLDLSFFHRLKIESENG